MKPYDKFAQVYDADQGWLEEENHRLVACLGIDFSHIVVEVGCGTGILGRPLAEKVGCYIGLDRSLPMLMAFKKKLERSGRNSAHLVHCDAVAPWPMRLTCDWVFFSINTIRELLPAQKQLSLLAQIDLNYLRPKGCIVVIFSNYFGWRLEDVSSLCYQNQVVDQNGRVWKLQSSYRPVNLKDAEFLCRFQFTSGHQDSLSFDCPCTWQPLEFYISPLVKSGFNVTVYGDFDQKPYSSKESAFAIVKARRRQ